jgi:predicted nucleic acid-binding protein
VVVDPRLLVMAVVLLGRSDRDASGAGTVGGAAARLLAVLAYGKLCAFASAPDDPTAMPKGAILRGRAVEEVRDEAVRRVEAVRTILPPDVPADLVLATSPHLTQELVRSAQRLQKASHVRPDWVVRQVNAHMWLVGESRPSAPDDHHADGGHLLRTARDVNAAALITSDRGVLEAARAASVSAYTLWDFVEKHLTHCNFLAIDPLRVIQASIEHSDANQPGSPAAA